MTNEEGEKWIVNLIRDSRMGVDAKIDLASVSRLSFIHRNMANDRTCSTFREHTLHRQLR
jgi:hypothetical protein